MPACPLCNHYDNVLTPWTRDGTPRHDFHGSFRCTWTCAELVNAALPIRVLRNLLDEPAHHTVLLRNPQLDLFLFSGDAGDQIARGLAWWCYAQLHREVIPCSRGPVRWPIVYAWSKVGLAYARSLITDPRQSVSLSDMPRCMMLIASHGLSALVPVLHFLRDQGSLVSPLAQRLRLYV